MEDRDLHKQISEEHCAVNPQYLRRFKASPRKTKTFLPRLPPKNKEKKRDPDAHSVKKGTAWHFGYKAHIGVDKDSGLVHHVEVASDNVHDVEMTPKLMTGDESELYGDSGYIGAESGRMPSFGTIRAKKSDTNRIASQRRLRSCLQAGNGEQSRRSIKSRLYGLRQNTYLRS